MRYIIILIAIGMLASCGTNAQNNQSATVIPSPLPGYVCFAIGTGGNCVKE